jgi:uncharacterized protein YabE (DUF348 family)
MNNIEPNSSAPASGKNPKRRFHKMRLIAEHPVMVPIATFAVLLLITVAGYLLFNDRAVREADTRVVVVSHDGVKQTVPSRPGTVDELLKRLDIKLGQGDVVEPARSTTIDQDDFHINVYRAKPVQIVDNGRTTATFSAATTSRSIARQSGVQMYPEDRARTIPTTNFLADGAIGERVVIERAVPITVNLYGNALPVRTHADTVAELLKEKNVKLEPQDQVVPAPDAPLTANQQVFVLRQGTQVVTETEQLPMPERFIDDPNLTYGTTAVRQQGSAGQRVNTYQVTTQNGQPTSDRKLIQSIVTQQPVEQVAVRGTSISGIKGDMGRAGIAPGDYTYVDYIVSKESGWNPTARNPSGAYGLCQSLPGSKMASAGSDWATNPITQLRWCDGYAKGKYGSWAAAHAFWQRNHWW